MGRHYHRQEKQHILNNPDFRELLLLVYTSYPWSQELSVIPWVIRDPKSYPWSVTSTLILRLNPPKSGGFFTLSRKTCTSIKGTAIPLVCAFRTCFCMVTDAAGRRMLNTISHFWNYIMNSVNLLNNSIECCACRLHHLLQHKQRTRVFCPPSVFYIRFLKREISISLNKFFVQGEALPPFFFV